MFPSAKLHMYVQNLKVTVLEPFEIAETVTSADKRMIEKCVFVGDEEEMKGAVGDEAFSELKK